MISSALPARAAGYIDQAFPLDVWRAGAMRAATLNKIVALPVISLIEAIENILDALFTSALFTSKEERLQGQAVRKSCASIRTSFRSN